MIFPVNTNSDPQLLDKVIGSIRVALGANFGWLNNIFGVAFRHTKEVEGRMVVHPAVYLGKREYVTVFPDEQFGNYAFFETEDPYVYESTAVGTHIITAPLNIVFWFNYDSMYDNDLVLRTENVKKLILDLLTKPGLIQKGRLSVLRIYDKPENIFKGYSINQQDTQSLMYPFAGLRFECTVNYIEQCNPYVKP